MITHEVYSDEANCKRCGRKITDALSLERGLGPMCYQKYLEAQAQIGFMDNQMSMEDVV